MRAGLCYLLVFRDGPLWCGYFGLAVVRSVPKSSTSLVQTLKPRETFLPPVFRSFSRLLLSNTDRNVRLDSAIEDDTRITREISDKDTENLGSDISTMFQFDDESVQRKRFSAG